MTAAVSHPTAPAVRFNAPVPAPTTLAPSDPDLLVPPTDVDRAQIQDALGMLYLLMSKRANAEMSSTQDQIASRQSAKDDAFKEQLDAIKRAAQAEGEDSKGFFGSIVDLVEDVVSDLAHLDFAAAFTDPLSDLEDMWNSPNFWKDLEAGASVIAKVALVAGGIAATVATAGTAGPVVAGIALALSAGGVAIQETDCLDGLLGKGASDWIGGGLQVAAGVVCFAGAAGAAGSWLNTVSNAAEAGGAAALVVTGVAHAKVAQFEGDVVDAETDAKAAQQRGEKMTRLVEWLIDGLRATEKSHERAKDTLNRTIEQHDQTQLAALFTSGRQLS